MKHLKRMLGVGLMMATILAATISSSGTAAAAPSGLDCPDAVGIGFTITCTFNHVGSAILATTESNGAASVIGLRVIDGKGTLEVQGNSPGGITICVTDGRFQTCESIEVIRFT
ncbi:MAG: hypothetical protein AAGF95_14605 [Chloroflexota bacterium]